MRFGLMSLAGTPEDVIADARLAADAGFDVIATADHLRHPRDPQVPGLDGWSILAAWAVTTERLRLAMLVSNLIYRHPVVLAKQVITVDQLSGGRVDVGVGAGVYPTDHSMAGVANWTPRERVDRLDEFVRALAAALDGDESFDGRFYSFSNASWAPGPRQQPRPPLAVGAVGPRLLRHRSPCGRVERLRRTGTRQQGSVLCRARGTGPRDRLGMRGDRPRAFDTAPVTSRVPSVGAMDERRRARRDRRVRAGIAVRRGRCLQTDHRRRARRIRGRGREIALAESRMNRTARHWATAR